jgi:hypothetical protein
MNLPRVSPVNAQLLCVYTSLQNLPKMALAQTQMQSQSKSSPHAYFAYQHLFLLMQAHRNLVDSEYRMIVISLYCDSNFRAQPPSHMHTWTGYN